MAMTIMAATVWYGFGRTFSLSTKLDSKHKITLMKKLVYLLTAFFAITLTNEDPMEDIHNEIDAKTTTIITGDVAFTMRMTTMIF